MALKGWSGHWHGFGVWVGTRDEMGQEYLRVPTHSDFMNNPMPPVMTGHALLRPKRVAATWTDAAEAVAWLKKNYSDRPPTGDYSPWEVKEPFYTGELLGGNDVVLSYYHGRNLVHSSVISCPNGHHPDIPCPQSPR